jgi:hypothetical protein
VEEAEEHDVRVMDTAGEGTTAGRIHGIFGILERHELLIGTRT